VQEDFMGGFTGWFTEKVIGERSYGKPPDEAEK
jgi:hypothetical protein